MTAFERTGAPCDPATPAPAPDPAPRDNAALANGAVTPECDCDTAAAAVVVCDALAPPLRLRDCWLLLLLGGITSCTRARISLLARSRNAAFLIS
jgi:hypothetical protein